MKRKRGRPPKFRTLPPLIHSPNHDLPPDGSTTPRKENPDSLTTEQIIDAAKREAGEHEPLLGTPPEAAPDEFEALAKTSAILVLTTIKELRKQVGITRPWPEYVEPPFVTSFVGLCKKYNLSPDVGPELMMFGCLLIIGKDFYAAYQEKRKAKQGKSVSGKAGSPTGNGQRSGKGPASGGDRDS